MNGIKIIFFGMLFVSCIENSTPIPPDQKGVTWVEEPDTIIDSKSGETQLTSYD